MGAAAYNRGSKCISAGFDREARAHEFVLLDDLNSEPKTVGAPVPFGPVHFVSGHGGWWAECPTTGYGFWYESLRRAVRSWRVTIVGVGYTDGGAVYVAVPVAREASDAN